MPIYEALLCLEKKIFVSLRRIMRRILFHEKGNPFTHGEEILFNAPKR